MDKLSFLTITFFSTMWLVKDTTNHNLIELFNDEQFVFPNKNLQSIPEKEDLIASLYSTLWILPLDEKHKLKITYDWVEYDLSNFDKKVLRPIEILMRDNLDPDFDRIFLFKIWILENMWSGHENVEVPAVLNKFSWNYIKHTSYKVSKPWASWTFQVMPATEKAIEKKYWISKFVDWKQKWLASEFGVETKQDMAILMNGLYGAACLYEAEQVAKNMWYSNLDEKSLAGIYNMWPKYLKTKNVNSETRWYIQKLAIIDEVMLNWQNFSNHKFF